MFSVLGRARIADGRLCFATLHLSLVCDACLARARIQNKTTCIHNLSLLPPWRGNREDVEWAKAVHKREETYRREQQGLEAEDSDRFFAGIHADHMAERPRVKVPRNITTPIMIGFDPAGQGDHSRASVTAHTVMKDPSSSLKVMVVLGMETLALKGKGDSAGDLLHQMCAYFAKDVRRLYPRAPIYWVTERNYGTDNVHVARKLATTHDLENLWIVQETKGKSGWWTKDDIKTEMLEELKTWLNEERILIAEKLIVPQRWKQHRGTHLERMERSVQEFVKEFKNMAPDIKEPTPKNPRTAYKVTISGKKHGFDDQIMALALAERARTEIFSNPPGRAYPHVWPMPQKKTSKR